MLPTTGLATTPRVVRTQAARRQVAMARPFDRYRHECPQHERVEDENQRDGGQRRFTERHLRERDAEQNVVREDAAHREHGLGDAVHPEQRAPTSRPTM